jgi:putative tryptophan/tyrosine transport system substrate-binding protein
VLMGLSVGDPTLRGYVVAFVEELAKLGWIDGRNAQIEQRWTNADIKLANALAKELLTTLPDVILASTTPATAVLHRETSIVPIVFAIVSDPVGAGFVASLRRPGGNITGFTQTEAALGGKWLSLLKDIAPGIEHAAIMFNPDTAPSGGNVFLGSFEAAARLLTVEPFTVPVRSDAEIETAVATLGRERAGLVTMDDSFMAVHFGTVISSSARNKVPTISVAIEHVRRGSLISYGPDFNDLFRRAAGYVDRILRGEKPGDLPVQTPTKYLTALNLKTAKTLGLTVPPELLATADEVIE